ncbi:MAG TPA: porin [Polyangia bacterium]|nr:porin [Polyangia bacterium]
MRGRTTAIALLLTGFCTSAARAADAPGSTNASVNAPATAPPLDAATTPADIQAAAAQRAAQQAEAQVIELRRQLEALERQRAGYDDVRGRLDQLDAHQREIDRQAAAGEANPPESSVVRFRDDGVDIRSPDNGFYLHPMVRIQAIYTGAIVSQGAQDPAPPDVSGFSLGRAEMILEGHVGGPFFQYRLQVDAAESPSLKDAYVAWHPIRMLSIWAGQFKVPYGLQRQYWKAELEFVNISAPMAAFSLERDLGLMVIARLIPGRLTVQAGLLNGSGANVPNDNFDLAYALRVVATPFGVLPQSEGDIEGHVRPLLSVGAAGYYNLAPTDVVARCDLPNACPSIPMPVADSDGDGRVDNVAVWQGGFELRALWRGAALQGELFGRLEDPGSAGPARSYWGAYVQGSYFLLPHKLQVAARAGHTDLPLYGATAEQRLLAGSSQNEQSAVVSSYLRGHRVKAQVQYSHLTSDGQTAPTANRIQAAVQVGF